MKAVGAVFALVILVAVIIMFPSMTQSITDTRTNTRTDNFSVTTGGGITTTDVVLVAPLWLDSIIEVVGITSDLITDVPLPTDYIPATRTLEVSGLTASDDRTLSVEYKTSAFIAGTSEAIAGTFIGYWPLLLGIAVLIILVGIAVSTWARR